MQYIRLKLTIVRGKLNNDSSFSFTDSDTHKKVIEEAIAKENNLNQIFNPVLFW